MGGSIKETTMTAHANPPRICDLIDMPLTWKKIPGRAAWTSMAHGKPCALQVSLDFPDTTRYMLEWKAETYGFNDLPACWKIERSRKPSGPKP
jgi:hypothetical protein